MICVAAAGKVVSLAATLVTLSWTHTIERVPWEEDWRLEEGRLVLAEARVKGSGAGMEPPADARLIDGWWRFRPALPPRARITLAASDAVAAGWRLCAGEHCHTIGALPDGAGPITIEPCAADADMTAGPTTTRP
ncbi:MAG: DUF1850 domain-containing protein [Pseudomonadota bacterium]